MHAFQCPCPHCKTPLRIKDRGYVGRRVCCPDCRQDIQIDADGPTGFRITKADADVPTNATTSPPRATSLTATNADSASSDFFPVGGATSASAFGLERILALLRTPAGLGWMTAGLCVVTLLAVVARVPNRSEVAHQPVTDGKAIELTALDVSQTIRSHTPGEYTLDEEFSKPNDARNDALPSESSPRDSNSTNADSTQTNSPDNADIRATTGPGDSVSILPTVDETQADHSAEWILTEFTSESQAQSPPDVLQTAVEAPRPVGENGPVEPMPVTLTESDVKAALSLKIEKFQPKQPAKFGVLLREIEAMSGVPIRYPPRIAKATFERAVNLSNLEQTSVSDILERLLSEVGLAYNVQSDGIHLLQVKPILEDNTP